MLLQAGRRNAKERLLAVAFTGFQAGRALTTTKDPSPTKQHASRAAAEIDFDVIYREQRGRVLATVRGVLGPSDEIEDVVQQVFVEIHRSLHRFEGRSQLSTWIYRVSVNIALQHIRKRKRKRWLTLGLTGEEPSRQVAPVDPARRLEKRELLEHVYAAAEKLSEKKRAVWVLHELRGLDPHEIGQTLGVPMNTVRSRLLAARKELQSELRRRGVLPRGGSR